MTTRDLRSQINVEEYDFVVVGAGSAGSVIASRLSENPDWKILLIEAGPEEALLNTIPLLGSIMATTEYGWSYKSVPQNYSCFGRIDNQCFIRAGRGLGGGSSVNGIVYSRGSPHNFNEWGKIFNSWSYEKILPYFKKSENVNLKYFDSEYHGFGGPLNIEDSIFDGAETTHFLQAGQELGYNAIDYNGKEYIGISSTQYISKKGRRTSTANIYLEPISYRRNLIIKTYSHATKILINEKKEAIGVTYKRNHRYLSAIVKKEVIISCGALNSPQLLMVSGIGPEKDLKQLNIPLVQNLKVGYNLLDHFTFIGLNFYYKTIKIPNIIKNTVDWFCCGIGPYRSGGLEAMAYVKTNPYLNYSDIEISMIPLSLSYGYEIAKTITNLERNVYNSFWKPYERRSFIIGITLNAPKSIGRLKLKSNSTLVPPLVDPKYLSKKEDLDTLIKGIRIAIDFAQTKSFKKLNVELNSLRVSGCEEYIFNTDEYWKCAVQILHTSSYHYHGTCKMGLEGNPNAVVDEDLKVHGIKNLRIVDNSIVPVILTGHLEATAVMIGEKAADLINRFYSGDGKK